MEIGSSSRVFTLNNNTMERIIEFAYWEVRGRIKNIERTHKCSSDEGIREIVCKVVKELEDNGWSTSEIFKYLEHLDIYCDDEYVGNALDIFTLNRSNPTIQIVVVSL
jgi:hypothetical protein